MPSPDPREDTLARADDSFVLPAENNLAEAV
jgi:hypothetical protein